jgi:endonuclease/exonuclease/phosphatase family metal-dependent hydrolase
MKVISYNLRKHRAARELVDLVDAHGVDVLCLQECDTGDLPTEISGLRLAEATQRNRLGLAVYYRANTFRAVEVRALALKKSLHDYVLKPAEERLLGVRLHDIDHGREIIVASFHAAPLTALNSLRRNQIKASHQLLQELGGGSPILMVGDYNYPLFKDSLTDTVRKSGYDLTLSDRRTYTAYKFFQGHFDFVTSQGFTVQGVETLARGSSDHIPIMVTAAYGAPAEKAA